MNAVADVEKTNPIYGEQRRTIKPNYHSPITMLWQLVQGENRGISGENGGKRGKNWGKRGIFGGNREENRSAVEIPTGVLRGTSNRGREK
jgi:hypothetical protein